jgi:hypothetical protein
MTQDEIIRMAREAGDDWDSTLSTDKEFLKRFAALVAAVEREACAKVCEEMRGQCWAYDHDTIAAAIRAGGQA